MADLTALPLPELEHLGYRLGDQIRDAAECSDEARHALLDQQFMAVLAELSRREAAGEVPLPF